MESGMIADVVVSAVADVHTSRAICHTAMDAPSNASKTLKKSFTWPSNLRSISCWLYSNMSGFTVNHRCIGFQVGALHFNSEGEVSLAGALQMCASIHVAGSPPLSPRERVWLPETYDKTYTLLFSSSKMLPPTPPFLIFQEE